MQNNTNLDTALALAAAGHDRVLTPNTDDMRKHIELLLAGHRDGLFEIANCKGDGEPDVSRLFGYDEIDQAIERVLVENGHLRHNVYIGATLKKLDTPRAKRTNYQHTLRATCLWVDCDKKGKAEEAPSKWGDLAPAMFAYTSRAPDDRAHFYFPLETPLTDLDQIEDAQKMLIARFGGDAAVCNPGRLMRLIGTINWPLSASKIKAGRIAEVTHIHPLANPAHVDRYSLEQLEKAFGGTVIELKSAAASTGLGINITPAKTDAEIVELFKSIAPGHWHPPMISLTSTLVGRGWTDSQIKVACGPYCASGADDPELIEKINSARKKYDKPNVEGTADPARPAIRLRRPFPIDPLTIKRREWIVPGLLMRRKMTMLVAPPGIGKSLLTLHQAIMIASGESWGGWRVSAPGPVLLINAEDDYDEVLRRMYVAAKHMKIDHDRLKDIVVVEDPENVVVAKTNKKTGEVVHTPVHAEIIERVKSIDAVAVIADPFTEHSRGKRTLTVTRSGLLLHGVKSRALPMPPPT